MVSLRSWGGPGMTLQARLSIKQPGFWIWVIPGARPSRRLPGTGKHHFLCPGHGKGSDDFSFSGLKTALLHLVRDNDFSDSSKVAEAAASFQQAVVDVLVTKKIQVAERLGGEQILVSGGVAANKSLRDCFTCNSPLPVLLTPLSLCTDNAAMIATCGYYRYRSGKVDGYDIDVIPSLSIG